jgi:molybdopterin synthase sulfur carrier subunit
MIRIRLPQHRQTLASCGREVTVQIDGTVTQRSVLDALEARYPMLRGTVREHVTLKRRPRVRFFADGEDVTFMIVGAVAGG